MFTLLCESDAHCNWRRPFRVPICDDCERNWAVWRRHCIAGAFAGRPITGRRSHVNDTDLQSLFHLPSDLAADLAAQKAANRQKADNGDPIAQAIRRRSRVSTKLRH